MASKWPSVLLGEVARHRSVFIEIDGETQYKRCRVQTGAKGVVLRDVVSGSEIRTKRQQVCRANDFLVAEIDAKLGGYGIIGPALDGAIVSSHYFLYEMDQNRIDPRFIGWFCRTPQFQSQVAAQGSTNYAAIRPSQVLGYRIPLPPLDEQRRVINRLDKIESLVSELYAVKARIVAELHALVSSLHFTFSAEGEREMAEYIELDEDRVPVEAQMSYPQVGIRGFAGGLFKKDAVTGAETSYKHFNRVREGLFLVSQPKGWEGAVAVCGPEFEGYFSSPEYRTFRCIPGKLHPDYLAALLPTSWFQAALAKLTRGQGARRERLRPEMLLSLRTCMPTWDRQLAALRVIERARMATSSEHIFRETVTSLLPATLHTVFGAGEV